MSATGPHPAVQAPDVAAALARSPVFAACTADDLAALAARTRPVDYAAGAELVREGDPAPDLLVIAAGEAGVWKRSAAGSEHRINRVGPGDSLGEMALFEPTARSATVRAEGPVRALHIPVAELRALAEARPSFVGVLLAIAALVSERLRRSSEGVAEAAERALAEERTRVTAARFTFVIIVGFSLYTWVLGTATQVKAALGRSELVTLPVVLVTTALLLGFMRSSGYPARFFGLTLERAGMHLREALLLTLPLMAATVALKAGLVRLVPAMHDAPLLQMFAPPAPGADASVFNPWLTLAYVVFVPLQELIYRGGLQGSLEHFLSSKSGSATLLDPHGGRPALAGPGAPEGRWRRWLAILGSNVIFSAAHLYISPGLSVTAFVAGLFWGWLYSRQRSLVGVSLSHILLGFWAFEVVDLGVLE